MYYVPIGCVPIFRPIREDLDPPNGVNIFQRNLSKNTKEKLKFQFLFSVFEEKNPFVERAYWSDQYSSFDTNIATYIS